MKLELVRLAFASVLVLFSGCNGCSGCEGQTPEQLQGTNSAPNTAATAASDTSANASAQPAPLNSHEVAFTKPGHDPTGVLRCCKEIGDNLDNAPEKHRATWKAAFDACNKVVEKDPQRSALQPIRDMLQQVGYPGACM